MARWKNNFEPDIRNLITLFTGFSEEEDNFKICFQFADSNIKYHRFLSVDSHKVTQSLKGNKNDEARVKLVLVGLKMSSKWPLQFPVITLPTNRSKVVTTVSLGLAILGLITAYFRLRKKCSQNVKRQVPDGSEHNSRLHSYLNGDVTTGRGHHAESPSGSSTLSRFNKTQFGSMSSLAASSVSTVTHAPIDTGSLSPIQLCHLGFETLQTAVSYWEDANGKLLSTEDQSKPAMHDAETLALHQQLERLLDSSYRMMDSYERQCERQADQVAFDSAITAYTTEMDRASSKRSLDTGSQSDQDSFVSATDMANLADLDNHREMFQHLPLYEAGLLELKHGTITCRTLSRALKHSRLGAVVVESGFETLQTAVSYWEDANGKLLSTEDQSKPAMHDAETLALHQQLERLLDSSYRMMDSYERQCERHADQVAFDSAITAYTTEMDRASSKRSLDTGSQSDQDSFVSATDMANLADLDNHREMFQHLPLYEAGLLELKHGTITCRTLRTEMTHCLSDTEFLAKLHCLRLALEIIFSNNSNKDYFRRMGKQIIGDILVKSERDPEEFFVAYDEMMDYVFKSSNWPQMEEELKGRGVKSFTFYDVVLDFILMDAFDDLSNPPSSVITVVQNRWLSNGFKETALSTAVWSVLKAKRRMLKVPDGFIGRFYSITEHTSPVLAWGFLGPDSPLKEICLYFKDIVLGFICDIFSFEKSRYTTLDDLSEDIFRLGKQRCEDAAIKLAT
ncbi:Mitoguardin 2,Mitoguardin,Mitoguardin 1 [Mytilus edulis]|uniref:Mitoguardin 2,Mitoguardin,Mitoguardin 1 n=1 Tax=Mytilus edulis TaxID=6550 RepID=A0A8S3Q7U6_MYTED|nr:Mitoguardin 2,Mitoguardin,Mitoguardin 1 [Mytilus edulis]